MANDLFLGSEDPGGGDVTYTTFARPKPTDVNLPLRWYRLDLGHMYICFMVLVNDRQGDTITFTILDRTTGKDLSNKITTNLFDVRNIYAWNPSSAQLVDPKSSANCGFLLLSKEFIATLNLSQSQYDSSHGAKWPEGAADDFATAIRKALQAETPSAPFTASERASLVGVLEVLRQK